MLPLSDLIRSNCSGRAFQPFMVLLHPHGSISSPVFGSFQGGLSERTMEKLLATTSNALVTSSNALVTNSFLFLVVMPGATSSFLL